MGRSQRSVSRRTGHVTMETVYGQTLALRLGDMDEHRALESDTTGQIVKGNLYLTSARFSPTASGTSQPSAPFNETKQVQGCPCVVCYNMVVAVGYPEVGEMLDLLPWLQIPGGVSLPMVASTRESYRLVLFFSPFNVMLKVSFSPKCTASDHS